MRLIHCPHPHCIKWVWIIVVITCLLFQVLPLMMMDRVMIPSSNVNETYHTVVVPQPSRSESINTASTTPRDLTAQFLPHRSKRTSSSSPSSASPKRQTQQPPTRNTTSISRSNNIIPMNSHKNNDTSTRTRPNILLIHIGKTGGETLKQILSIGCQSMKNRRRKQSCYRNLPRNNRTHIGRSFYSALSIHTHGYYHCDKMIVAPHIQQQLQLLSIPPPTLYISKSTSPLPQKTATTTITYSLPTIVSQFDAYLFTIRHPVDRIWSWYNYVHPQHCPSKYLSWLQQQQQRRRLNDGGHSPYSTDLTQTHPPPRKQSATKNNIGTTTMIETKNNKSSLWSSSSVGISCQTVQEMTRIPTGFATTFFFKCFPTIQDWSDALLLSLTTEKRKGQNINRSNHIDDECIRLARQSIRGELPNYHKNYNNTNDTGRIATHLMANYRHYMNHTIYSDHQNNHQTNQITTSNTTIYVVRTEHLWDDLRSIDVQQLQGDGDFGQHVGTAMTHGVPIRRRPDDDNEDHRRMVTIFCCALMDEMEQYLYLIHHAQNLVRSEKQHTIESTIQYCMSGSSSPTLTTSTTTTTTSGANHSHHTDQILSMTTWKDILQRECDHIR